MQTIIRTEAEGLERDGVTVDSNNHQLLLGAYYVLDMFLVLSLSLIEIQGSSYC